MKHITVDIYKEKREMFRKLNIRVHRVAEHLRKIIQNSSKVCKPIYTLDTPGLLLLEVLIGAEL
jgi:hypothetical protein